ncbi:unnamed protein product, partial [Allacma fusca]
MHLVLLLWYALFSIWEFTNLNKPDSVALFFNQIMFLNIHHGSKLTGEPFAKNKYRHIFLQVITSNWPLAVITW